MKPFLVLNAKRSVAFAFPLVFLSLSVNAQEQQSQIEHSKEKKIEREVERALANFPDISIGEKLFSKCKSCHTVGEDSKKRMGPPLNGIVGRGAASNQGFKYSAKMKAAAADGLVWSVEELDAFLNSPRKTVSGTSMAFVGIKNPEQRKALIAFLASFNADGTKVEDGDD